MTKVCAFCFQFFEYDDVEEPRSRQSLGFHHVTGATNVNVHHDSVKADPKSNKTTYRVSYPSRRNLNRPFTTSITVSSRNRSIGSSRMTPEASAETNKEPKTTTNLNQYYGIKAGKTRAPSPADLIHRISMAQEGRIHRPSSTAPMRRGFEGGNRVLYRKLCGKSRQTVKPIRPLAKRIGEVERRKPLSLKLHQKYEKITKSPYKEWLRVLNDDKCARKAKKTQHAYYVPMHA